MVRVDETSAEQLGDGSKVRGSSFESSWSPGRKNVAKSGINEVQIKQLCQFRVLSVFKYEFPRDTQHNFAKGGPNPPHKARD